MFICSAETFIASQWDPASHLDNQVTIVTKTHLFEILEK